MCVFKYLIYLEKKKGGMMQEGGKGLEKDFTL
jgi:hypothetical protein